MLGQRETQFFRDGLLLPFNDIIIELLDSATIQTDHMVMVTPLIQFEHRLVTFERVSLDDTGRFEVSQDPIHRGKTDLFPRVKQRLIDIFGAHMKIGMRFQYLQNLHPRQCYLQARVF